MRANAIPILLAFVLLTSGCTGQGSDFRFANTEPVAWTEGEFGTVDLVAGGTPPYQCAVTQGALPDWLALNGCALGGTPPILAGGTVESLSPPFTIQAIDSANPAATITMETRVTVKKPQLTLTLNQVTCFVGIRCAANMITGTVGGAPPYHYQSDTFREGTPPWGTVVGTNGLLIGIPTTEGTYTFGVCAVDSIGTSRCEQTTAIIEETPKYSIELLISGTGTGTVTADPYDPDMMYDPDTMVELTAVPAAGSTFAHWEGGCTGSGTCMLTMSSDKLVTAVFTSQVTYSGQFSLQGTYGRPFPEYGTTCIFDDTFSGTISMDVTEGAGGSVSGTASVSGTFTSNAVGGSISGVIECQSSTSDMGDTTAISGTKNNIMFTSHFFTAGGSDYAGAFTGSLSGNTVTGTFGETSTCCSGSSSTSVTLTAQ